MPITKSQISNGQFNATVETKLLNCLQEKIKTFSSNITVSSSTVDQKFSTLNLKSNNSDELKTLQGSKLDEINNECSKSSSSSSTTTNTTQATSPGDSAFKIAMSSVLENFNKGVTENHLQHLIESTFTYPTSSQRKNPDIETKNAVFYTQSGENVLSPSGGNVITQDTNACDGFIEILTKYENEEFIIGICGVVANVTVNQKVDKGDVIGKTKSNTIKMTVKRSKNSEKIKVSKFYIGKQEDDDYDDVKDKLSNYSFFDFEKSNRPTKILTLPLRAAKNLLGGAFAKMKPKKPTKSQVTESVQELNEEIKRIKKLM